MSKKKSTTATTTAAPTPARQVRAAGVATDNFIEEEQVELLIRRDKVHFSLESQQLIKESLYSTHDYTTNTDGLHAVVWCIPILEPKGDVVDARGLLGQLDHVVMKFTNESNVTVTIHGSVPVSRITTPEDVSHRRNRLYRPIKPGSSTTLNVRYRNTANDYPHQMRVDGIDYFRLLDFYVTYPDTNIATGSDYAASTKMVSVECQVTYTASDYKRDGVSIVERKEYALLGLGNYQNVYLVDPPVSGPRAMMSRKQVVATENNKVTFVKTGTELILQGQVYGQQDNDFLITPFQIQLGTQSYDTFQLKAGDSGSNWTALADRTFTSTYASISAAPESCYTTYSPMIVGYVRSAAIHNTVKRNRRDTGGTLEDSWGGYGDGHRGPEKRSLIVLITLLEAAVEVLNVVKRFGKRTKNKK